MTEPYYSDEYVTLYHGDCLEQTAWLDADVLITDPPYGLGSQLSAGSRGKRPLAGWAPTHARTPKWDATLEARDAALGKWGNKPYAVFGSARRIDAAPPHREVPLVWDKESVGLGDVTFPWGSGYELIYINGDGWIGKRSVPVIRRRIPTSTMRDEGHPSFKPVDLMGHLISKAPPGAIADPFAGSGSTLVAAALAGRRAIGVELEERYCEIAARRLSQGVLDFGAPA